MAMTILQLEAAIAAAKATGQVTGFSLVRVVSNEPYGPYMNDVVSAAVEPAGEFPETTFVIEFNG